MASRQQRYIPHVRDVFQSPSGNGGAKNSNRHSPDRRGSPLTPLFDDRGNQHGAGITRCDQESTSHQKSMQHRADQQYGNYGRTLTEKDVKHIERHLSMKKTIRKQLSRHLTQSYLDAELTTTTNQTEMANRRDDSPRRRNDKNSKSSGTNFLELLKDVRSDVGANDEDDLDRDSGHCSPTDDMEVMQSQWQKQFSSRHAAISVNPKNKNNCNDCGAAGQETKKSSFWKKLTVRAKIKH